MSRRHRSGVIANVSAPAASARWLENLVTAPELLNRPRVEIKWHVPNVVAPGVITFLFAPRGLGKSLVMIAWAVRMANAGVRVLLLDRDNGEATVQQRMSQYDAAGAGLLTIKFREDVPPLTDKRAWAAFPFWMWDVVIVDAFDSATEGIGEKDSAKASESMASLLDIVRRRKDAPAVLVLGNTTKDGSVGRGVGPIQDRLDIVLEARDATGFKPNGRADWWHELPSGAFADWADRASRRTKRTRLRMAFMASKFRVAAEPPPWIVELNMDRRPWHLVDVTDQVELGAAEAAERITAQVTAELETLAASLYRWLPMLKTEAYTFLTNLGMPQKKARSLVASGGVGAARWTFEAAADKQGKPVTLIPVGAQSQPV